jgi:hypothetical protein
VSTDRELPPLPEPKLFDGVTLHGDKCSGTEDGYTADQMRAYAGLIAEDCAKLVEALRDSHCAGTNGDCQPTDESCEFVAAWNDAIAAIRARYKAE